MILYLVDLIKRHEGLRLKPYKCTAGKLTIGYGRNLEDCGITEAEANAMLDHDIAVCLEELSQIFPRFYQMPEKVQCVLVDMLFNLGKSRFLQFKKMIQAVKDQDYKRAAAEMKDSKWYSQVPSRADEDITIMGSC